MPLPDVSKLPYFDPALSEVFSAGSQAESYLKFFDEKLRPEIERRVLDQMSKSSDPLPYETLIGIQMQLVALRAQKGAMESLIRDKILATSSKRR